ncbi:MAG: tRNA (adenosine(37)-N6)-dimethylallyltransferase MiaA [Calditrichaceae bacterium]|nr:tRNA (adenosine(37)-N6)-dimethylallyltransferase MiaA [Calditrichaceae bacterium]MBN2710085.1 tRNA (adenosine(37)-N6)-dimethylallyltransferase MiaA [Calditrichaceae bacterium]RQV94500.1 MAG: tRNA (adenosine(37)-N6)-dimethylallyltransferase MiaA [Calditrichota bacterium]
MKKQVLFIVGPTASGKTNLSLQIAEKYPVELISADSRQIYRFMDIGTAKPEKSILERFRHHFVNIFNPDEYYSAGRFGKEARHVIDEIFKKNRNPLVAGGSGFYIKALIDGIFDEDIKDEEIRDFLNHRLEKEGLPVLFNELAEKDTEYASRISANDTQRILRSLEVIYLTGKPFSAWHRQKTEAFPYKPVIIGLDVERKVLYERINRRVDDMIHKGLVDEAQAILDKGYSLKNNALNTVGYKEVIAYLNGEISMEEMIELIKRNTRRYAKRQMTWFRADKRILWRKADDPQIWEIIGQSMSLKI